MTNEENDDLVLDLSDAEPEVVRHYGLLRDTHDSRDFMYAPPRDITPPMIDLSAKYSVAPFDQGALGSCGPNSAAGDILYDELQAGIKTMPSRLFIYYVTRAVQGNVMQDSGVSNRDMLKALNKYGWCDEPNWPYDISRFTVKPPAACFTQAATRKIDKYLRIRQDLDSMKGCLAAGDPFIFGFTVYQSFESAATTKSGIVPMPKAGERILGGHDVLFVGYDDNTRMFYFRNSWGPKWGIGGYGRMPYSFAINPKYASDFWTIQWAVTKTDDVTPTPSPANSQILIDVASKSLIAPSGWSVETR